METRCGDTVGHALTVVLRQHIFGYVTKFMQNQVQKTMVPNDGWCGIYWCKEWSFLSTFTELACYSRS